MLARPLPLSRPPSSACHVRTYAIHVRPSKQWPNRSLPRVYPERKRHLLLNYTRLIESSPQKPVFLFLHSGFNVPRQQQLRNDLVKTATRHASIPSLAGPSPAPIQAPTFTVMNSSIFGVALRDFTPNDSVPLDMQSILDLAGQVKGEGLAALTFPSLNPPFLNATLKMLEKTHPKPKPKTQADIEKEAKMVQQAFVPGRRLRLAKPEAAPQLRLVGAFIEGRLYQAPSVLRVAELPTLETLRAQLVGMLSAPAMQLSMVLSEASGAKLHRTLEGLRQSMEERDAGAKEGQSSAGSSP
ncbi:hypothetical protein DAEQUDRAFT_703666 [Daedalea quercina L-15889]|uniref:Ribosomal protein L10 n=1 Tax=Daedalea quercina L-15889 TaxID=1314783 RepID=A0A165TE00_9APHY|nr:hypothetical protein DAEQUDRAFT_703666 [Daedalea quercina L-15889]